MINFKRFLRILFVFLYFNIETIYLHSGERNYGWKLCYIILYTEMKV